MCGMPPSVRRIVAENPVALAGAGAAPASSAITALATTTGAINCAGRRVRSNAAALLLTASPSPGDGSLTDERAAQYPGTGGLSSPLKRRREAVDAGLSRRIRAPGSPAPLGSSGALQHRGRRLRSPSAREAGDDPRALLGRDSRGELGRAPGPVKSLREPSRPAWSEAR